MTIVKPEELKQDDRQVILEQIQKGKRLTAKSVGSFDTDEGYSFLMMYSEDEGGTSIGMLIGPELIEVLCEVIRIYSKTHGHIKPEQEGIRQ